MKKYLVVTNIWGKRQKTFWQTVDSFKEEREYFDTLEEAKEYCTLFEEIGKTYETPKFWNRVGYTNLYDFTNTKARAWGYLIADTEEQKVIKWGGIGMYNLTKKDDVRYIKDRLFRGEDEIPKNYKWDNGEYEGWLQFRWGDGKNAVDYVEPQKKKEKSDNNVPLTIEADPNEDIEDKYADIESRDRIKRLENRW